MRVSILMSLLAACTDKTETDTGLGAIDDTAAEECAVNVVVFDYEAQASWAEGDPDCAGESQSPVDVSPKSESLVEAPVLTFSYGTTPLHVVNNGHSVEYEVEAGTSTLDIDGVSYTLKQLHFHAPSEHTIDGQHVPMELHLVHASGDDLAVVGIFIVEGDSDQPWFTDIGWDALPAEPGDCLEDEAIGLDMADLISSQLIGDIPDVVHYSGSLTTPPCSEGVEWFLMGRYLSLSAEQIASFTAIYEGNNRDVQDLNGRVLGYDEDYGQ
jgi:carbonic anhydrase